MRKRVGRGNGQLASGDGRQTAGGCYAGAKLVVMIAAPNRIDEAIESGGSADEQTADSFGFGYYRPAGRKAG